MTASEEKTVLAYTAQFATADSTTRLHSANFYKAAGFNAYHWNVEFPWAARLKPEHRTAWQAGYDLAKKLGIKQFPKAVKSNKKSEDKAHGISAPVPALSVCASK